MPASDGCFVAQVFQPAGSGDFPVARPPAKPKSFGIDEPCGLETHDTADWPPLKKLWPGRQSALLWLRLRRSAKYPGYNISIIRRSSASVL